LTEYFFLIRSHDNESPVSAKDFFRVQQFQSEMKFKKYSKVIDDPLLDSAIVCPEGYNNAPFFSVFNSAYSVAYE